MVRSGTPDCFASSFKLIPLPASPGTVSRCFVLSTGNRIPYMTVSSTVILFEGTGVLMPHTRPPHIHPAAALFSLDGRRTRLCLVDRIYGSHRGFHSHFRIAIREQSQEGCFFYLSWTLLSISDSASKLSRSRKMVATATVLPSC